MRGYFGIGIEHPKTEYNIGTLWRSAQTMGAAFIFTIHERYRKQSSDTMKTWKSIPLLHYTDLDDFYNHMPHDCRLIGVELDPTALHIRTFVHPDRCLYLLGAEDHGLTVIARTLCHSMVQLPGKESLNVAVAGSIVMYDRNYKNEN